MFRSAISEGQGLEASMYQNVTMLGKCIKLKITHIPPFAYSMFSKLWFLYLSNIQLFNNLCEKYFLFFVINSIQEILYKKQMTKNMKSLKEEFLEILTNYQGILHKVSLVYFKNKTEREDNIQEIIYQLWKSFPTIKNHNSIGSWIYAVSINTSLSRVKKESKVEYRETIPELADKSDVIESISMSESLQLLLNAIYNLDELDKSIMLLYLEEKSYDEIAEIIGISRSNVGVRINRIKEFFKRYLNK